MQKDVTDGKLTMNDFNVNDNRYMFSSPSEFGAFKNQCETALLERKNRDRVNLDVVQDLIDGSSGDAKLNYEGMRQVLEQHFNDVYDPNNKSKILSTFYIPKNQRNGFGISSTLQRAFDELDKLDWNTFYKNKIERTNKPTANVNTIGELPLYKLDSKGNITNQIEDPTNANVTVNQLYKSLNEDNKKYLLQTNFSVVDPNTQQTITKPLSVLIQNKMAIDPIIMAIKENKDKLTDDQVGNGIKARQKELEDQMLKGVRLVKAYSANGNLQLVIPSQTGDGKDLVTELNASAPNSLTVNIQKRITPQADAMLEAGAAKVKAMAAPTRNYEIFPGVYNSFERQSKNQGMGQVSEPSVTLKLREIEKSLKMPSKTLGSENDFGLTASQTDNFLTSYSKVKKYVVNLSPSDASAYWASFFKTKLAEYGK